MLRRAQKDILAAGSARDRISEKWQPIGFAMQDSEPMNAELIISCGTILRGPVLSAAIQQLTGDAMKRAVILPDEFAERVFATFGTPARARTWLNSPNPNCPDGKTPLDTALTGGIGSVYHLLGRIEPDSNSKGLEGLPESANSNATRAPECNARTISATIRKRLLEFDSTDSEINEKVQVAIMLPREADRILEAWRHCYRLSKTEFFTAADGRCIQDFERLYGGPISSDPARLHMIEPSAAERLARGLRQFQDQLLCATLCNAQVPGCLDAKLSNAVYLLDYMGWKISKRVILGSSSVNLLNDLVKSVGLVPIPDGRMDGVNTPNQPTADQGTFSTASK